MPRKAPLLCLQCHSPSRRVRPGDRTRGDVHTVPAGAALPRGPAVTRRLPPLSLQNLRGKRNGLRRRSCSNQSGKGARFQRGKHPGSSACSVPARVRSPGSRGRKRQAVAAGTAGPEGLGLRLRLRQACAPAAGSPAHSAFVRQGARSLHACSFYPARCTVVRPRLQTGTWSAPWRPGGLLENHPGRFFLRKQSAGKFEGTPH